MHGWTAPDFVEIKMDAEIGSYQEDFGPLRDSPPLVMAAPLVAECAPPAAECARSADDAG